jgi:hypothetical protein
MLVMDGSGASDFQVNQADVARYREQLTSLRRAAGPEAWLLVHQPLWTVGNANPPGREPNLFFGNPNLLAAIEPLLPYPVRQVVSGHQHIFVALAAAGRPAQLVVGQGGTMLDDPVPTPLPPGLLSGGARIDDARFILEFGYMVLNRTNDGWTGLVRDTHGRTISTCTLPSSGVTCTP